MSATADANATATRKPSPSDRLLRRACYLALVALALMVWSMLDPRPIPVVLAMSLAQLLGTLSFAIFLIVVVRDLRVRRSLSRE